MQHRITVVVIGAVRKDDKFLMTKRIQIDPEDFKSYHGAWQLPGGGMEFGETPEATLYREIQEETGVEIEIVKLVPKIFVRSRKNWQGVFIVYVCRMKDQKAKIKLNAEASACGWYTLEQAKKLKTMAGSTEIIEECTKY